MSVWTAYPKSSVAAVVVACFAVVAVAVGVIGFVVVDPRASTPAGEGRIQSCSGGVRDLDDGSRQWTCTVAYRFQGESYSAPLRRTSAGQPSGTVRVFVDPAEPTVATFGFSAESKLAVLRVVLAIGAVVLAGSVAVLVALRVRSR